MIKFLRVFFGYQYVVYNRWLKLNQSYVRDFCVIFVCESCHKVLNNIIISYTELIIFIMQSSLFLVKKYDKETHYHLQCT